MKHDEIFFRHPSNKLPLTTHSETTGPMPSRGVVSLIMPLHAKHSLAARRNGSKRSRGDSELLAMSTNHTLAWELYVIRPAMPRTSVS